MTGSTQSLASLRVPDVTFHSGAHETSSGSIQPTGGHRETDVCIRVSGQYYQTVDVCEFSAGSLIDVLRQVVGNGFDCGMPRIHVFIAGEFPEVGPTCNLDFAQHAEAVLHRLSELSGNRGPIRPKRYQYYTCGFDILGQNYHCWRGGFTSCASARKMLSIWFLCCMQHLLIYIYIYIYIYILACSTQVSGSLRVSNVSFHKGAQEIFVGSIQPSGWHRERDVYIRVSGRCYRTVDVCEFRAGALIDVWEF